MSLAHLKLTALLMATAVASFAGVPGALAQGLSSRYAAGSVSANGAMGVQWTDNLDAARAAAKASGKLVLVHFWTPSCGPCRLLDSQVFNQPTVAGPIQQKYVPVKINANESRALAESYGITQVPTDVIVTPEGNVVRKLVSPATPMAYVSRLTSIATQHRAKAGAGFQQAAAQAPYNAAVSPSMASTPGAVTNNPYANLAIPAASQTPAAGSAPVAQAAGATAPAPQQVTNPYTAGGRYAQAQTEATPNPASLATQEHRASAASAQPPVENPYVSKPYAAQPAGQPPAASVQQVAETTPPAAGPTAQVATQEAAPQLPPGTPPLGFEGYCPVTMKKSWKWARGDAQWGAIHRGRTYLFAGATQRDEFLKNPELYSPAMSGLDPVLALEQGQQTPGQRKFALEYQNQFYLFSSEQTLNKFWTNAEGYAQGVRQAMSATLGRTVR